MTDKVEQKQKAKEVPIPEGSGGGCYPNNVASTQTEKTRGTGAAIKGTKSSKTLA
jgi:hypothetical protein